ncbi:MAG: type II secretion system protein GspG [Planctomycetota bacterium]|nr:type II secretion system protein GspG [Planctomycetota bacterium]
MRTNSTLFLLLALGMGVACAGEEPTAPRSPESRIVEAQVRMRMIGTAIDLYRMSYKKLPDSLPVLTETDDLSPDPFLHSVPKDPWGNSYEYRVVDRKTYEMRSFGPDGIAQTEDDILYPKRP